MRQKRVRTDLLVCDPNNARLHPDHSIEGIKASLEAFGQVSPIVVSQPREDGSMVVLAGNGTFEAAKRNGQKTIFVVVSDLSAEQATAYSIADNQTGLLSQFSVGGLIDEIGRLPDDLVEVLGFSDSDLAELCDIGHVVDSHVEPPELEFDAYSVRVECIKADEFSDVMAIVSDVLSSYGLKAVSK